MKRILPLIACIALFALPLTASAQAEQAGRGKIEAGGAFHLPVGDFGDAAGIGFGAFGSYVFALNPQLELVGTLGLIYHLPKEVAPDVDFQLIQIPILAGVRFHVTDPIYVNGQIGLNFARLSADSMGVSASETETELAMLIGGGYEIGKIDVAANLMISSLDNIDESLGIMLTAAIELASL